MTVDVTVLGCGVAGLCTAAELSARGLQVRMLDPQFGPGAQSCSWWAGGMLAPDCESERAEEPVMRLGREASGWWTRHGADVVYNGSLVVALDRDFGDLKRFAERTKNHEWLNQDRISELEPDLGEHFKFALFMTNEAHLDPRAASLGLRDRLVANGVKISDEDISCQDISCQDISCQDISCQDISCRDISCQDGHFGQIIDCTGLAAKHKLVNLRGVKGEMVVLRSSEIRLARPIRLLHPRFPLYVVPRDDGLFMLGATQIESGDRHGATVRSIVELLNAAYALHPAFAEAEIVEIGVDARPAFPDNLPRITQIGERLYVNGLFRHGFLLAPALARMVGELIVAQTIPELWGREQVEGHYAH